MTCQQPTAASQVRPINAARDLSRVSWLWARKCGNGAWSGTLPLWLSIILLRLHVLRTKCEVELITVAPTRPLHPHASWTLRALFITLISALLAYFKAPRELNTLACSFLHNINICSGFYSSTGREAPMSEYI